MTSVPVFCGKDCGGGACPLVLRKKGDRILGLAHNPASDGLAIACQRGFGLLRETLAEERLLYPLIRNKPRSPDASSGAPARSDARLSLEERGFRRASWDEALSLVAERLRAIRDRAGPEAILDLCSAGSIGAVHSTSTLAKRFFSLFGGSTELTGNYSNGAARTVLPYIFGPDWLESGCDAATMADSKLIILWGANVLEARLGSEIPASLLAARRSGIPVISIDPRKTSTVARASSEWIQIRPGTDSAMMLAILYVLFEEGLADRAFLSRHSAGFEALEAYIRGTLSPPEARKLGLDPTDLQPRSPHWAAILCGVSAAGIAGLARRWAATRPTMLLPGYSIQRVAGGEESFRLAVALQLATGNTGLRGGSTGSLNNRLPAPRCGSIAVPDNPAARHAKLPVLRWPDAVLRGRAGGYPSDIAAAYVTGTNPASQSGDTGKALAALRALEFLVVQDLFLTPTAACANVVLPVASALEKEDIGMPWLGNYLLYKAQALSPRGAVRNDYEIFADLAARLGFGEAYTEGRSAAEWVAHFVATSEVGDTAAFLGSGFWAGSDRSRVGLEDFGRDPAAFPLGTASGKVEILNEGYRRDTGCPAIPSWRPATRRSFLGADVPASGSVTTPAHPKCAPSVEEAPMADPDGLLLITPKSPYRTHSQWWNIEASGQERFQVLSIHPEDAKKRGISEGEVVRIASAEGSTRARAHLEDSILPGVVSLPEGAWPDPDAPAEDGCGAANRMTSTLGTEAGTSCIMHGMEVRVERLKQG